MGRVGMLADPTWNKISAKNLPNINLKSLNTMVGVSNFFTTREIRNHYPFECAQGKTLVL